jgi:hypothetical protein
MRYIMNNSHNKRQRKYETREKLVLGLLIITGFIGTVFTAPVLATVTESFLTIERAKVSIEDDDDLIVELDVEGLQIPTDGSEGAFGYGILTEDGDTILVAETHAGVLDSEEQRFIGDPTWHTHLVRLGDVEQCGEDQGIVDITWQSPGEIRVDDNIARISGVPTTEEFEGWNSITGGQLSMTLGEAVLKAVSFKLDPVFDEGDGLEAVCVTDIRSAEEEVSLS